MILYHGGTETVTHPICKIGRPNLDFGQGFYLTSILDQAAGWAAKQADNRKGNPIVNVYEFDYIKATENSSFKHFASYDEEWLDFIINSRNGLKPWSEYDIIEGGVANDRVIDTIDLYTLGIIDKRTALGRLAAHQPNNQICILNQDIIEMYLTFVKAIEL